MRYRDAIAYLYGLAPRGISLGLDRMEQALALRGQPQHAFRSILVAGTNGKGSVCAMLASVLRESGLRVGLYTSPHLHRLVERFRVDGRVMPNHELTRRVAGLRAFLEQPGTPALTFFEACTLLAFEWFRDQRCDVVVLEVGLGGRLDATNVVRPLLSVVTHVALDHQDRLGPTLRHIAREKAGIIKAKVPAVVSERQPEARAVLAARARRVGAPLYAIERDFSACSTQRGFGATFQGRSLAGLRLPLAGAYQVDNLACAVASLQVLAGLGLPVQERALRRGLRKVRWPGRLEMIAERPALLCDAAHNPDACQALEGYLREHAQGYRRKLLMFGVLADKDYHAMLQLLRPLFDELVFATPDSPRAAQGQLLAERYGGRWFGDVASCVSYAKRRAGKRGLVVAAGSILWMSSVRAHVLRVREDPKIAL